MEVFMVTHHKVTGMSAPKFFDLVEFAEHDFRAFSESVGKDTPENGGPMAYLLQRPPFVWRRGLRSSLYRVLFWGPRGGFRSESFTEMPSYPTVCQIAELDRAHSHRAQYDAVRASL